MSYDLYAQKALHAADVPNRYQHAIERLGILAYAKKRKGQLAPDDEACYADLMDCLTQVNALCAAVLNKHEPRESERYSFIYKSTVDHTRDEAVRILQESRLRCVVRYDSWLKRETSIFQIQLVGVWHELARTDLADDVCTGGEHLFEGTHKEVRERFIDMCRYGARVFQQSKGPRHHVFAVIDRMSDG